MELVIIALAFVGALCALTLIIEGLAAIIGGIMRRHNEKVARAERIKMYIAMSNSKR